MNKKINFDIKKLMMTPKERQLEKLKKFLERITTNTNIRLVEFEITEGTYIPNNDVSEMLGEHVEVKRPFSGKTFIFASTPDPKHPEINEKYLCMSLDEVSELIDLYKEALNMK